MQQLVVILQIELNKEFIDFTALIVSFSLKLDFLFIDWLRNTSY